MRLIGEDLDGNPVDLTTLTAADGRYSFTGLASGTYRVIFDPNGLTSNSRFTQQDAGADDALDSDGDPVTGETAVFTLAPDADDPTWDQGLIIDRNVAITVDKKVVDQTDLDGNGSGSVTYELVVTNTGTAEGSYDLDDRLQFGGGIRIESVTAANVTPGDVPVSADFDGRDHTLLVSGQRIAGGETHTFRVVVEASVSSTVSSQARDCVLEQSEEGTGFLNEAELTVDGSVSRDTACGEVPPVPPVTSERAGLATTGGVLPLLPFAAALGAIAIGLGLLVRRRRAQR